MISTRTYLRSIQAYFEMLYCVLILAATFGTIINYPVFKQIQGLERAFDIVNLRILESILSIVILNRLFDYLRMIDRLSPLITTIYRIFGEVFKFVIISVISIFAFAVSFYLIGLN